MKKLLGIFAQSLCLGILFSTSNFAQEADLDPTDKVFAAEFSLEDFSEAQHQCMRGHELLPKVLKKLLNEDQTDLSEKFVTYLKYKNRYYDLVEQKRQATDPREKARLTFEIQETERDWSTRGFRLELSSTISELNRIEYQCRDK